MFMQFCSYTVERSVDVDQVLNLHIINKDTHYKVSPGSRKQLSYLSLYTFLRSALVGIYGPPSTIQLGTLLVASLFVKCRTLHSIAEEIIEVQRGRATPSSKSGDPGQGLKYNFLKQLHSANVPCRLTVLSANQRRRRSWSTNERRGDR